MESCGFRHLAFISYSRADNEGAGRRWADWLKQLVERFPLEETQKNVFLDRETLPAGKELDSILREHLSSSKYLILVGSPRSAKSKWVSAEIEWFKQCRGSEYIIPMVIDGTNPDHPTGNHWVAEPFHHLTQLTYADFRVKERQRDQRDILEPGWTDPAIYRKHLAKRGIGSKSEIQAWITKYEDSHKVAKFALLSQLFAKPPEELERIERESSSRRLVGNLRRKVAMLGFAIFMLGGALWASIHWARKAENERASAERSLMAIGDAHEESIHLISDVLSEIKKSETQPNSEWFSNARKMIDARLAENAPTGNESNEIHMRAVVLDNRAYLARKAEDFEMSIGLYREALALREDLLKSNPDNGIYLHNLAVSHDNLGDIRVIESMAAPSQDRANELRKMAESEYRESIEISRKLASRKDATNAWRHDLAVGLFKLGDTLDSRDDEDLRSKAVESLKEGMVIARDLTQRDPKYPKWRAHLAFFCLRLGQIQALSGEDRAAKEYLMEGKSLLESLRDQGLLTHQYGNWLSNIETSLMDLN